MPPSRRRNPNRFQFKCLSHCEGEPDVAQPLFGPCSTAICGGYVHQSCMPALLEGVPEEAIPEQGLWRCPSCLLAFHEGREAGLQEALPEPEARPQEVRSRLKRTNNVCDNCPTTCPAYGRQFTAKSRMERHWLTHLAEGDPRKYPVPCVNASEHHCIARFADKQSMQRHAARARDCPRLEEVTLPTGTDTQEDIADAMRLLTDEGGALEDTTTAAPA